MTIDLNIEVEKTREKIEHLKDRLRDSREWTERRWLIRQLREQKYLLHWQVELLKRAEKHENDKGD